MKTSTKTKRDSYKNVMIQDEGGMDFIRVTKKIWESLTASRSVKISTRTISRKALA